MTTTPLFFEPLPEPRDPQPRLTYQVTLRVGGEHPRVFLRRDFPDLLTALDFLQRNLPEGRPRFFEDLRYADYFAAVHLRELGPHHCRLSPIYFHQ